MVVLDFEVTKYDWLVVLADTETKEFTVVHNSREQLQSYYDAHKDTIWVGYNIRHYDQWILKAILCDLNAKEMNDWIIVKHREPWKFSNLLRNIPLTFFDVMPNPPVSLKALEGFLGLNIKETDVPFDIDRSLTDEELKQMIYYCTQDVKATIAVLCKRKDVFNAQMALVRIFDLPLSCVGKTEAQITAQVLDCHRQDFNDEFRYYFLPCIRLKKYKYVQDWFAGLVVDTNKQFGRYDPKNLEWKMIFYSHHLETVIAGVPHTFGFGGIHGAVGTIQVNGNGKTFIKGTPIHWTGLILHVDVGSYYPSMLIAWSLETRAANHPEKYKGVYDTRMALKRAGKKKEQAPYKKLLNALSGAMKDQYNPAYDPRNNNIMCINGQLMLLDLIEHLEDSVDGFELAQSNTDGLIIRIPESSYEQTAKVCREWEARCSTPRCSIKLGLDRISELYQGDVNNYLWIEADGSVTRIGAYVKELGPIDNDLPVINKALVERLVYGTPVRRTIYEDDNLLDFQKIVKLSDKFDYVEHNGEQLTYKSYRVFASKDERDGRIYCVRKNAYESDTVYNRNDLNRPKGRDMKKKFGTTPDHCFIANGPIAGRTVPQNLDKEWYVQLAEHRLSDKFGVT